MPHSSTPLDFSALFDASPNPYMVLDRELRFVAANQAYTDVTGRSRESLVGRKAFDVFPHDPSDPNNESARVLRGSLERVLATRKRDVLPLIHYRIARGDGEPLEDRYWSATHTPLLDADGAVAFVLQHTVDITDLHRLRARSSRSSGFGPAQVEAGILDRAEATAARNRLLDVELRDLRRLFDQSPGFVAFLRGPTHVFEITNGAYDRLIRRDVVGKTVLEAVPEVEAQGFVALLDQVYRTGEPYVGRDMVLRLRRTENGPLEPVIIDFVYQPILDADGSVAGIFVQGNDITEQKRLADEREHLATIVEQSADFIGVADAQGHALWVNEAGRNLVGLDAADVRRHDVLDFFPTEDRAFVRDVIEPSVRAEGQWTGDLRFRHFRSGEAIDAHYNIFALREPGTGKHVGIATVSRDMRAQKALEAERAELLAREKAARGEAERANQLKDEFLATVSHELRTPLNAIQGWAQLLRAEQLPESRRAHALETIERNARTQAQIIDDILDVSRIMSGKLQLDVEAIDLGAVVDSAMETLRPAAEAKRITLEASFDPRARVMGDAVRLQQVVWNLLSNAVKFTGGGGRVRVVARRSDSRVELEVTDTGRGIAPAFLPHVFERFRQAEGSISRTQGGLGLGLAIVKQIVEMHGGAVSASSAGEGTGATFAVHLPVLATRAREEAPAAAAHREMASAHGFACPPELAGVRVLVVDDEEDTRELLTEILEQCGARVVTAGSASEALARLRSAPLDVIVSDIGMPGEDGFALLRKVRLLPVSEGGGVPAIALTAYTRAEDRARAEAAGFTAHVAKPVDVASLLGTLVDALGAAPRSARTGNDGSC